MAPVPRDIYKHDVDFTALALQFPDFARRLKPNGQLDFSDPESVRQLTKSLLLRDFGISLELPDDRLCPPVPNRLNYIFWLQDILDSTSENYRNGHDPNRQVIGLDIGTGASCIYPLLGCRERPQWRFLASEIDPRSYEYAKRNIEANALNSHVKLISMADEKQASLLPVELQNFDNIDFVMTNPPFYASEAELIASAKKKQRPPNSACTGAPIEMITHGGEIDFVSKLIIESMQSNKTYRIQWFSSMLGKLSSVSTLVERLRQNDCTNYAVTEFVQGQKTRRWAIAWSWRSLRPRVDVARGIPVLEKRILPFPSESGFEVANTEMAALGSSLDQQISALDLQWQWKAGASVGMGVTKGDVWSRKARRRKRQQDVDDETDNAEVDGENSGEEEPALVFKISLSRADSGPSFHLVHVRWMRGDDSVLFESFCGWLKRKIVAA